MGDLLGTPTDSKAYIDTIEDLEMVEKWGVVISVTRKIRVCGLTGTTYATMYQVLDQLDVPVYNDELDEDNLQLVVTDRNVKMIDKDKADVTVVYGPYNDKGQSLADDSGNISSQVVAGKMSTSIVQKETNLYTNSNGDKQSIVLTHTYPATDQVDPFTGQNVEADPDFAGKTVRQTGMVNVQLPQRNFTIEGIKNTLAPWDIAESLIRCTNALVWLGQPPGTWMCTEVTWEYRKDGVYFMTFSFQHEEDEWDPTVVFIDEKTSRPPPFTSVADGSILSVPYFTRVDFVQELGFFVIGPQQD